MPRLFSGIEIPKNIRQELTVLQSGIDGARWIAENDFHITLRFAGNIAPRQAEEFSSLLAQIKFKPFEITLNSMGFFDGRKPRAIWIGLKPCQTLDELHRAHEMAARNAGLKPEPRKFMPHITLARLRDISSYEIARYLESLNLVTLPPFDVTQTAMFSAREAGGGGPYHVEKTYPPHPISGNPGIYDNS